ncbi:uncharacterized protein DSM5745_06792 [Aspergillus mulundensis]|uniref:Uncharacterized protein n=1 Tax=Aspergillus mulundensis TaxID=1810919 RepID=A0A3D8RS66_9EURO|nr:hypothetical protein DSM5745_06792 [Aspergillus mulundensis]RDW76800.1 hypothetical protein DSM5745_06792 [Aspergillus mulundensis]
MSDFATQRTVTNIIADVVQVPKNRVHPGLAFGSAHLNPTDDQLDEIRRRLIDVRSLLLCVRPPAMTTMS